MAGWPPVFSLRSSQQGKFRARLFAACSYTLVAPLPKKSLLCKSFSGCPVCLSALKIIIARIHSFRISRKNAANGVRFLRNAVLKRAVNYFKTITCAWRNRILPKRPLFARPAPLAEKVNAAFSIMESHLKVTRQRKTRTQSRPLFQSGGERWVFPKNHGIFTDSFRKNS